MNLDRGSKALAYALGGIREYWIINLRDQQIEAYLKPNTETGTYGSVVHYPSGETFASPFCGAIAVDDLLPEETAEEE